MPDFTITIDYSKGRFEVWYQKKEKIPPDELKRLLKIKERIEKMIQETKQPELIT